MHVPRKTAVLHWLCFALPISLVGCSIKPVEPYVEPASGTPTASLRVITNGGVGGGSYKGCVGGWKNLATAGRFKNGSPSINYIQQPEHPPRLPMPARIAPALPELPPVLRRAEGSYAEIVAEYRVPAGEPFLLHSIGASAGGVGNQYSACPGERGVFQFEANKHYEMMAGMFVRTDKEGNAENACIFSIYELMQIPPSTVPYPVRLSSVKPSEKSCAE